MKKYMLRIESCHRSSHETAVTEKDFGPREFEDAYEVMNVIGEAIHYGKPFIVGGILYNPANIFSAFAWEVEK